MEGHRGFPRNIRGRHYRGINAFLLALQSDFNGWEQPLFLTFRQAKELGGKVRKGEKSTMVVFWKVFVPKEYAANPDACPPEEKRWMLRYYRVFNVAQVDGLPPQTVPQIVENDHSPIEACEQIVANMPNRPKIRTSSSRASYNPALDRVQVPVLRAFDTPEGYHSTLFHELTHATGHDSRLARRKLLRGILDPNLTQKRSWLPNLARPSFAPVPASPRPPLKIPLLTSPDGSAGCARTRR